MEIPKNPRDPDCSEHFESCRFSFSFLFCLFSFLQKTPLNILQGSHVWQCMLTWELCLLHGVKNKHFLGEAYAVLLSFSGLGILGWACLLQAYPTSPMQRSEEQFQSSLCTIYYSIYFCCHLLKSHQKAFIQTEYLYRYIYLHLHLYKSRQLLLLFNFIVVCPCYNTVELSAVLNIEFLS